MDGGWIHYDSGQNNIFLDIRHFNSYLQRQKLLFIQLICPTELAVLWKMISSPQRPILKQTLLFFEKNIGQIKRSLG